MPAAAGAAAAARLVVPSCRAAAAARVLRAPGDTWPKALAAQPASQRHLRLGTRAKSTSGKMSSSNGSAASSSSSASSASSASSWLLGGAPARSDYDAIMVLGGGLLPDGGLPEWVVRRLEGAAHLYAAQAAPCPVALLGAGTPHKAPVLDAGGFVLHESSAYATYLLRRGIPAGNLLKELHSYDTVGNAYFSLLIHALPAGWRRIAVVTSEFHMLRTQATFDFCFALAGRQLHGDPAWFSLDYHPVSDEGIFSSEVLLARTEKEVAAVQTWQRNTANLHTLADLHAWLFATHLCYSVARQQEFGKEPDLDPRLAATY